MEIDKNQQKKKGLAIKIMKSLNSGLKLLLKFSARQNTVLTPLLRRTSFRCQIYSQQAYGDKNIHHQKFYIFSDEIFHCLRVKKIPHLTFRRTNSNEKAYCIFINGDKIYISSLYVSFW